MKIFSFILFFLIAQSCSGPAAKKDLPNAQESLKRCLKNNKPMCLRALAQSSMENGGAKFSDTFHSICNEKSLNCTCFEKDEDETTKEFGQKYLVAHPRGIISHFGTPAKAYYIDGL